jgi:2-amino-4-hydroxy-6-hydroxymethyldihydropteridine diphosphokinase
MAEVGSARGRVGYAYVALGANLGDRQAQLIQAARAVASWPGVRPGRSSRLYQTEALVLPGADPQPDYLNAVIEVVTRLPPAVLLAALLEVEARLGRHRQPDRRWAPRPIDLDLLFVELAGPGRARTTVELDQPAAAPDLPAVTLPHPHLHRRGFVLAPLAELRPSWRHPRLGLTVPQMLAGLEASERGEVRALGPGSLFLSR